MVPTMIDNPTVSPRFPRHDPEAARLFAERVLFEEMEHAAKLLQTEQDFGRAGVEHAVRACHGFLHVRGLSGQGLKPLMNLIAAMESVEEGSLPELFDPKVIAGEVPDRKWSLSAADREIRLHAAACMSALMKGGMKKFEAAARVTRYAQKWPRMSQGVIKQSTVTYWRDQLLEQVENNPDRQRYERKSEILSKGPEAKAYLEEVLCKGPMMTGGVRKSKT